MVSELTIQAYDDPKRDHLINTEFAKMCGIELEDYTIIKEFDDRAKIYIFLEERHINILINIIKKYSVVIENSVDFTNKMIDIILDNKLEDFVIDIHPQCSHKNIIDKFYFNEIESDMILDKIHRLGINSLTKNDKIILEEKSKSIKKVA